MKFVPLVWAKNSDLTLKKCTAINVMVKATLSTQATLVLELNKRCVKRVGDKESISLLVTLVQA